MNKQKSRSLSGGAMLAVAIVIGFWSMVFGVVAFSRSGKEFSEKEVWK